MTATPELIYNNLACGRIKGGITASQLYADLYPGDAQLFLSQWSSGKYFYATITDALGNIEIVKVTNISGNRITISRGQDGTSAIQWYDGAVINQRFNAALMDSIIQKEAQRQVAFNPNGVLTAAYPHEKVFQLGQKIWWKNVSGTVWQLICGIYVPPPPLTAITYNLGTYNNLNCVVWSPELELFCALSGYNTGRALTSVDGITWNNYAINNYTWDDICWSPSLNLFCASGWWSGSKVMTSPDGQTWSNQTPQASRIKAICWSSDLNLFCGISHWEYDNGHAIQTSPNGVTWTLQTTPAGCLGADIIWCHELGLFITIGGAKVMTSPDGVNWTNNFTSTAVYLNGICYSPELNLLVVVGSDIDPSPRLLTSPNGTDWTERHGLTGSYKAVEWSPELELFVAFPENSSAPTQKLAFSEDGIIWDETIDVEKGYSNIAYSPALELFCAVRDAGGVGDPDSAIDVCLIS